MRTASKMSRNLAIRVLRALLKNEDSSRQIFGAKFRRRRPSFLSPLLLERIGRPVGVYTCGCVLSTYLFQSVYGTIGVSHQPYIVVLVEVLRTTVLFCQFTVNACNFQTGHGRTVPKLGIIVGDEPGELKPRLSFLVQSALMKKSGTVLLQFDYPNALVLQQAFGVLHCQKKYRQRQTTITFPFGTPALSGFGPPVSKALN